ncbi:Crp/Fnr family transcriptional regulator [Primorskyibacter sp. S187A]|uniref:Crp/Fnr family transcriptional regulator n=1 Tax=Primorskyibacter sp. S187A TaxID=3415130 RepID=UPI003C7DCEE8
MTSGTPERNAFSVLFDASAEPGPLKPHHLTEISLRSGEALFDQSDFDDKLYILDAGRLEVSVLSAAGRKLSLNQLEPGAVFGEIAVLAPGPRTARIAALAPSRLRAIGQKALRAAIEETPALAVDLLELAGQRMRWMSQQMEEQVFMAPTARLAAKLLFLMGPDRQVKMSQEQLAHFVGVTREVVSKNLSRWQTEGLVEIGRGRVTVKDVTGLEDLRDVDLL